MRISRRTFANQFGLAATGLLLPRRFLAQDFSIKRFFTGPKTVSNGLLAPTVGYWKLDDTTTGAGFVWTDATGNGWGATQHGTSVQSDAVTFLIVAAEKNLSASDGSGLAVSASIDTRSVTTAFTVSLWVMDAGNGFANDIMGSDDTTNRNWSLYTSDSGGGSGGGNFVSLQTWRTTGGTYDNSITAATSMSSPNTRFDHILAGYDGTNRFIIFNNGTKVTSAVVSVGRGSAALTIGIRGDFLANFAGRIDEVAYFNADVSSKVSTLYNGGSGLPFSSYS